MINKITQEYDPIFAKAYLFALNKHQYQVDDNGENYFYAHCINVYLILSNISNDIELLSAALLHDTIEDTDTTYEELVKEFGNEIADLVNEVTHEGKKDSKGYYFPRLKTKRGIMLKFADRLSNLSRMESWDEDRVKHYLKTSKFWKSE